MGLMSHFSSGNYNPTGPIAAPNPDPRQFQIEQWEHIGLNLVVCIRYPNCTTYEGLKVLVFARLTVEELRCYPLIDPHFSDIVPEGTKAPIARFVPTNQGWALARITAAAI